MRYIFFGTSEFAAIILEKLLTASIVPVAVVTQPDREAGRGKKVQESPVKLLAKKERIPLLQPEKIAPFDSAQGIDFQSQIIDLRPDLFIVAAYGNILPKELLAIPKEGALNVHASLLPKYRGASPMQAAILHGEKETGVTIMRMDEGMDTGPIVADYKLKITDSITTPELERQLADMGAELLIETLPLYFEKRRLPEPQDIGQATYTKILTKEDGHIDWTQNAEQIERHVRAMMPWPGSWTMWAYKGKKMLVQLKKVTVNTSPSPLLRGEGKVIGLSGDAMLVVCGKNILAIHTLQPEGKKEMPAKAFVNGHPSIIGSVLI